MYNGVNYAYKQLAVDQWKLFRMRWTFEWCSKTWELVPCYEIFGPNNYYFPAALNSV
jgi:hypothetical protein